jgi:serine/threonine protein kinase
MLRTFSMNSGSRESLKVPDIHQHETHNETACGGRGKVVDRRADIWAFGVVLFEMLTGQRAFDGDDISITLAAVMMKEPDWTALPASMPVRLSELLRRCVTKDPRARLRDIGEARIRIEELASGTPAETAAATTVVSLAPPEVSPSRPSARQCPTARPVSPGVSASSPADDPASRPKRREEPQRRDIDHGGSLYQRPMRTRRRSAESWSRPLHTSGWWRVPADPIYG